MTLQLGWLDILVLLAYIRVRHLVGLYVSGKSKNFESYLLGDRDLRWWAILGSIVATETSAATGAQRARARVRADGMKFLQIALGYIVAGLSSFTCCCRCIFADSCSRPMRCSISGFGGLTRRAASLLFLVARKLGDGLRLFLAAIVLEKADRLAVRLERRGDGRVATVYTFVGGMRSVIWNDCIQFAVYVMGE